MTLREFIIHALSQQPYASGATATQIWRFVQNIVGDVKLQSLSSQLCKMTNKGELEKLNEFGPRKGNGYRLSKFLWRCWSCHYTQADSYDSCCHKCGSSEMFNVGRK
jgi:hypothetical protein